MSAYDEVELYAWIGVDDSMTEPRTTEIGLKQGLCPAGMIPLVATSRAKMESFVDQMAAVALVTEVPRVLARFTLAEVVRVVNPIGSQPSSKQTQ